MGRFLQARHLSPTSTELERAYLTYDEVGNPKTRDMAGGKFTWTYDVLNQLESERRPGAANPTTWTYDYARRRETERTGAAIKTWTYDAADQLSKETVGAAIVTYSYDADGNRTLRNDGARTTYVWDQEPRLTGIQLPDGSRVTSAYRHDGLRLSRQDAAGLVTYVWDGRDVLSEEGASPQLFVRGHCLARAVGPGRDRTYLKQDGETVQALATSAGALETTYTTDAWGSTLTGSAAGNPYVYHGGLGYAQDVSGLQYVRARWLDPGVAQWLSVDPVSGEPRYSYAHQMPVGMVDPSGTKSFFEALVDFLTPKPNLTGTSTAAEAPLGLPNYPRNWSRADILAYHEGQREAVIWASEHLKHIPDAIERGLRGALRAGRRHFTVRGVQQHLTDLHAACQQKHIPVPFGVLARAAGALGGLGDRASAAWEGIFRVMPALIRNVAPPLPGSYAGLEWRVGFLWGAVQLLWAVLPFSWVFDLLIIFGDLLQQGEQLFQGLDGLLRTAFPDAVAVFTHAKNLDPFDRGELLATLLGSFLLLVLIVPAVLKVARTGARLLVSNARKVGPRLKAAVNSLRAQTLRQIAADLRKAQQQHRDVQEATRQALRTLGLETELAPVGGPTLPRDGSASKKLEELALKMEGRAEELENRAAKALEEAGKQFQETQRALPAPRAATAVRNSPGTAVGGRHLPVGDRDWLRGSSANVGRLPRQVADDLRGRFFRDFDDFREQFWRSVATHPELLDPFSLSNRAQIRTGNAPFAHITQWRGGGDSNMRYNLHHRTAIENGGGVYDLDNIIVVTPRYHEGVHNQ